MPDNLTLYPSLLSEIKQRIYIGQTKAALAVSTELISLYWDIGQMIHQRQQQQGWGAGIIPRLSKDIANELPEVKGFSERNLKRMLRFYREYAFTLDHTEGHQLTTSPITEKVPQAVAQLPWGHNILLIERIKEHAERFWYAEQATKQQSKVGAVIRYCR